MVDRYYSPYGLVDGFLNRIIKSQPKAIADFTCGTGSLLQSAATIWPAAHLYGNDLDKKACQTLKTSLRTKEVFTIDFECIKCQDNNLHHLVGQIDLILWNPPFSTRGGTKYYFHDKRSDVLLSCSKAVQYVLLSLRYLTLTGSIVAIVPFSVRSSQRDASAIVWLGRNYDIEWVDTYERGTFDSCTPATLLLYISPLRSIRVTSNKDVLISSTLVRRNEHIRISRGKTQLHSTLAIGMFPVFHTTDLSNTGRYKAPRFINNSSHLALGNYIILPRVGLPKLSYLNIYEFCRPTALSDCLFLVASDISTLERMCKVLQEDFDELVSVYSGTCAKYCTLPRIEQYLYSLKL